MSSPSHILFGAGFENTKESAFVERYSLERSKQCQTLDHSRCPESATVMFVLQTQVRTLLCYFPWTTSGQPGKEYPYPDWHCVTLLESLGQLLSCRCQMINVQKALPSSWTTSLYELLRRHLLFHMQSQEVTEIKHKGEKDILISWPYHTYQFECSCNGVTSLYFMSTVPSSGVVTCGSFVAQARTEDSHILRNAITFGGVLQVLVPTSNPPPLACVRFCIGETAWQTVRLHSLQKSA